MALEQQLTITVGASSAIAAAPLSAELQGTTVFTNDALRAPEIAARARCRYVTLHMNPGLTASNYSTHIAAVRASAAAQGLPSPKFLAYINCSEVQATSSAGVWGPFWTLIENNNWWARNPWPNGNKVQIAFDCINLASPRKVGGFTAGESFVNQYHASVGTLISQCDGVMLDNMNYRWPVAFDYLESNSTQALAVKDSAAMRNAIAGVTGVSGGGWKGIYNRFKAIYGASFEIHCNPRIITDYLTGVDDRLLFAQQGFAGFMNQNGGPGQWFYSYRRFPYDGAPPTFGNIRTYPGELAIVGTPAHGDLLVNTFQGFAATAVPVPGLANPHWMNIARELMAFDYIPGRPKSNIRQETYGYYEPNELVAGTATPIAQKQAANRVAYGSWWCMTDASPYMHPLDTPISGNSSSGTLALIAQHQYNWGNWIDPACALNAPYVTVSGHSGYMRRADNAALLFNPIFEFGEMDTAPAFMVFPTPPPPSGKTWKLWGTNTTPGATINVATDDVVYLQAA